MDEKYAPVHCTDLFGLYGIVGHIATSVTFVCAHSLGLLYTLINYTILCVTACYSALLATTQPLQGAS